KCSAGYRAVVHEKLYDQVVQRVKEITETKTTANPLSADVYMGPVIEQASFDKITDYFEVGKEDGRFVTGGTSYDSEGYFLHSTIFADLEPTS
ncbi:aldehyde dehydrogenase family protein, partial [Bacillus pumilus]